MFNKYFINIIKKLLALIKRLQHWQMVGGAIETVIWIRW